MQQEQVARIVAEHPWVRAVEQTPDGLGIRLNRSAVSVEPEIGPLMRDYLDNWRLVYDYVYVAEKQREADDLDLSGWTTSDSGQPIAVDHMTEWAERTVELIAGLRPKHVLELGCGTGLLLYRLLPMVDSFVGTDISPVSVRRLQEAGLPGVAVVEAGAHGTGSAEVRSALDAVAGPGVRPDCIVLNSVSMHFPNAEYFTFVIDEALDAVADGGSVVIGDVRHFGLLPQYCRWLEQAADPGAEEAVLDERARTRAEQEDQLLVSPEFIIDVAARHRREVQVTLPAKTMHGDSELNRYRYDVVLHVDGDDPPPRPLVVGWDELRGDRLATLRRVVEAAREPVEIRGIPNRLLAPGPGAVTGAELYDGLPGNGAQVLLDAQRPDRLVVAAAGAGRRAAARTTRSRAEILHEPFRLYLDQRVPEGLRHHLRRAGVPPAEVPIVLVDDASGD